jgi:hypothetical protein
MKKYFFSPFFLFCGIFFVFSVCSKDAPGLGIFPDLLRSSPFEITKWSPGSGYHADPSALSVSLTFSHVPDRASVERNFSLTGDGEPLGGTFHWSSSRMIFVPASLPETNRDYVLSLAADAHDQDGLSMDKAFEGRFTTRPDNTRPGLVSFYPEMNAVVNDTSSEARLVFSRGISINSLYDHVSFNPSINGSWRIENDGTSAVFTPAEPWAYGRRYELKISSLFAGNNGVTLGHDFLSVFTVGEDLEKPCLHEALRLSKSGNAETLGTGLSAGNSGWEKDDRLRLKFSKPVDTLSVRNCLSTEGAPSFRMETMPGLSDEAVFYFETPPVYGSRFSFRIKPGVRDGFGNESGDEYIIAVCADGAQSKPPALVGIRLPMAPGSSVDPELKSYGIDSLFDDLPVNAAGSLAGGNERYPYNVKTETWIECYFETAPGLSIDIFSLMGLFSVETSNNVLVFSPRLVKSSGFSVSDPEPAWGHYRRLEIRGFLTNTINSGVVTVQINSGLKDTGGNRNEKAFSIPLLK